MGHRRTPKALCQRSVGDLCAGTPGLSKGPQGNAAFQGREGRHPYVMEWFQNTQTGLLRSSVSRRVCSTRTGLSRGLGSGAPSLYTTALTTGVLMTGRLGSLQGRSQGTGTNLRAALVRAWRGGLSRRDRVRRTSSEPQPQRLGRHG